MKINMAVEELPWFTALGNDAQRQRDGSTGGLFIAPSIDYMQKAYEDARQGNPSEKPFMNIHMQSAVDPSVAPPGKHTISIFAQYFPYTLQEAPGTRAGTKSPTMSFRNLRATHRTFRTGSWACRCSRPPISKPASV